MASLRAAVCHVLAMPLVIHCNGAGAALTGRVKDDRNLIQKIEAAEQENHTDAVH